MPFLDWVNKTQAVNAAADVPYHLLQFQSAHGDASAANLLIQGDNLLTGLLGEQVGKNIPIRILSVN